MSVESSIKKIWKNIQAASGINETEVDKDEDVTADVDGGEELFALEVKDVLDETDDNVLDKDAAANDVFNKSIDPQENSYLEYVTNISNTKGNDTNDLR